MCVCLWYSSVLCWVWPRQSNPGDSMPDKSRDWSPIGQLRRGTPTRSDIMWLRPLPEPPGVVHRTLGSGNLHVCTHTYYENIIHLKFFTLHMCPCVCVKCSAECGNGTQTRSVACIFNNNGRMEVVDQLKCSSLSQPITAQPCRLKPCGVQWHVTEWSAVSVPESVITP